jgi:hypothetical protein
MHPAMNRTSMHASQLHDIPHPEDFVEVDLALQGFGAQRVWPDDRFGRQATPRRVDRKR